MAFVLAAATACQETALTDGQIVSGETVEVSISAKALVGSETKAALPDASSDDLTYYLEVYKGGVLYDDLGSNTTGVFVTRLVSGQEFTLVAWADHDTDEADFYDTDDLTNVILNTANYAINTTDRDAFAGTQTERITETTSISMVLTRPFARINIATTDIEDIKSDALVPSHVQLVYNLSVYSAYNVLESEVVGDAISFTTFATETVDTEGELSVDYLFAPIDGGVANFTANYTKNDEIVTEYVFSSIPYKRNYQTNVSGNLLTKEGTITVTVDQEWDGEEDYPLED